jgi:hypothetical protein
MVPSVASLLVICGKAEYSASEMLDNLALDTGDVMTVARRDHGQEWPPRPAQLPDFSQYLSGLASN